MFGYISSLFSDPAGMLLFFLLAFPGRMLAISAHEYAHAYVADKCGDSTARSLGRLTLNPLKHLDPVGLLMMLLLGFGWAKPVPVNPHNYRNYRRDDLKVSLAGITMNLILFLLGEIVLAVFLTSVLHSLPHSGTIFANGANLFVTTYGGESVVVSGNSYWAVRDIFRYATSAADFLVTPACGRVVGGIYQMIAYFVQTNIVLAVFNLIPVPPLDGYHVVNDLLIKRSLFASPRASQVAMMVLMALMFTGILGSGLSYVYEAVITTVGSALNALIGLTGLI